jgi:CRP/FNR family transcriptional regulator
VSDLNRSPPIPWAAIPLFQNLLPEERERVRPLVVMRSFDQGEAIFREGDPAARFHFIIGGRVKIVKSAPDGKEIILEILGPGDPVGAVAVFQDRPFPASAVPLETTSVLTLPAPEFFALTSANPALMRGILAGLTRRLMELTRRLADRSARAELRVARLLLTLAERMGRREKDGLRLPLVLSRQEIAELVGITQETAIRIMSRWGKEGLVLTESAGFLIPDPDRLRDLAPED